MENNKEKLLSVLRALNTIPVSGQNVYTMVAVFNTINEIVQTMSLENKEDG